MNGSASATRQGEVLCRPAVESDCEAIAALRGALGRTENAAEWTEKGLSTARDRPRTNALFVAQRAGALVGYAAAEHFEWIGERPRNAAPPGYYLAGIVVDPAHRLRGVGLALVEARLRWIANHSKIAYYYADDDNLPSIAIHEKVGFRALLNDFAHPWVREPNSCMTLYVLDGLRGG